MKAKFFQRCLAYIFDLFIIGLIIGLIKSMVVDSDGVLLLNNKLEEIADLFFKNKIGLESYINRYSEIYYQLDYKLVVYNIFQFIIYISYFVIFQYYNKGQTIGKKIWGIKVVNSKEENLTMNMYAIRALIIYGLFGLLINLVAILIFTNKIYYFITLITGFLQFFIVIITVFMVLYKKDGTGIHDLIAKTKVIIDEDRR
jgi:uncharacterized RDD family membrane protein YckC